jgi:hypothetical protein
MGGINLVVEHLMRPSPWAALTTTTVATTHGAVALAIRAIWKEKREKRRYFGVRETHLGFGFFGHIWGRNATISVV